MRRPTQFGRLSLWTIGAKGASRPSVAHGLLLTPRSVDFDFFVSLPPSPSQPMRSSCLSDWISLGFAASYRNLSAERSILLLRGGYSTAGGAPQPGGGWSPVDLRAQPTGPPPTSLPPLPPPTQYLRPWSLGVSPPTVPTAAEPVSSVLRPSKAKPKPGLQLLGLFLTWMRRVTSHATPPHCPELRLHIPKVYHTPTPNAPSTQCHDPLVVCPAPSPRLRVCISLQGPIWRRPACVLRPVGKVALARSRYSAWEVVIAASACLAPGCKVLLRLHLSPSRYLVSRYISIGSMTSVVPNYSYSTFR